jgi:ubiquinone/menaquinone biosynthesis C-methylase UbiE
VSRGHRLTCLEPGQDLAKLGKNKFESSGNVNYIVSRLEDWQVNKKSYDLAISAQAFHWVERPLGFKKMALALKNGGHLGLFWNMYLNDKSQFIDQLANLCFKYDINLLESKEKLTEIKQAWIDELEESQYFSDLEVIEVPWSTEKTRQGFINFLSTSSEYIGLEPKAKDEFNKQLTNVFSNAGGSLKLQFVSTLYVAQKNN